MSTSPISTSVLTYLQSTTGKTSNAASTDLDVQPPTQKPDNGLLSPFAKLTGSLHFLQKNSPAKYTEVTQQIAAGLQGAAQTAQTNGHTALADRLTTLAGDFTSASNTGHFPDLHDKSEALAVHHYRHQDASGVEGDAVTAILNSVAADATSDIPE